MACLGDLSPVHNHNREVQGANVVAAAAYRSACRLQDDRLERPQDFTAKAGVIHSEILAPDNTPARWRDRQILWNEVDRGERRKDAQLARDVLFSLPHELGQADAIDLARQFVVEAFVARGMVADLNIHWEVGVAGRPNPHAHVMLSMREAGPDGFGLKVKAWNDRRLLLHWRETWAEQVNARLAQRDLDIRVDHRSLRDQGIDLEAQKHIGSDARRAARRTAPADFEVNRNLARRNGERIRRNPALALQALTQQQSTFTREDLAKLVFRQSDGKDQFDRVMSAVMSSRELIILGPDSDGRERLTSRDMLTTEQDMASRAERMASRAAHPVTRTSVQNVSQGARRDGLHLSAEQTAALAHVAGDRDLALVIGYAGSGKSTMLGLAREIWNRDGYRVRGVTLSGVAAENLEQGTAIPSQTIASLQQRWLQNRDRLTHRDVLVIDEAGLIGSRQMHSLLVEAERAGAKLVMVGDPEQLQAIEAGAAFRALADRHGAIEITAVQRQREDWQREATKALATGQTREALKAYGRAGRIEAHPTRMDARHGLVEAWAQGRDQDPTTSCIMLAATRADVEELNRLARMRLKADGSLHGEKTVETPAGPRPLAVGERVMFLRNDRALGVKNGTFATLEKINAADVWVKLDDGRRLAFDPRAYTNLTHGYAATIHKAQGVTVDHAHVLASRSMDRHGAYVGLTRHRQSVSLYYGRDDFSGPEALIAILSRDRSKDVTLDYGIDRRRRNRSATETEPAPRPQAAMRSEPERSRRSPERER